MFHNESDGVPTFAAAEVVPNVFVGADHEAGGFFLAERTEPLKIPAGALLLVSDSPMVPDGVKTEASDLAVTQQYVELHLKIGIDSLRQLINNGITVKHLRY